MSDGEFPDGFSDEDSDTPDDTPDEEGEVFSRAQGRVNNSGCGWFKCALYRAVLQSCVSRNVFPWLYIAVPATWHEMSQNCTPFFLGRGAGKMQC